LHTAFYCALIALPKAPPVKPPPLPPNLPLILSTAIGLPVLLLACSLLIYLLWKRHRRRTLNKPRHPNSPPGEIDEKFGSQVGHLPPDGRAPELDSFPVAMTVRRSPSGRKSELEGSSSSSAGTGVSSSPAISSLGGGAGTGGRLSQFGGGGGQGSPLSPGLQSVREEQQQQQQEPYELWGGYVPYRPPQSAQEVGKPGGGGYYGDEEKPGMSQ
ncbi:hypothetical protein KC327_g15881, partial [Hortaea werneckii]